MNLLLEITAESGHAFLSLLLSGHMGCLQCVFVSLKGHLFFSQSINMSGWGFKAAIVTAIPHDFYAPVFSPVWLIICTWWSVTSLS